MRSDPHRFTTSIPPGSRRNAPTVINAAYNYRNFWDGRANNVFNGVSPFGPRDPGARVRTRRAVGVAAARDPAAARSRVAAQLAEAEAAEAAAIARANAAKAMLASYWGGASSFEIDTQSFERTRLRGAVDGTAPDIALAEAERVRAAALVQVERAKQAPDPSVRGGFRQLRETDSAAFVVGVRVPLPIWNRNGGAIAAARAEASRAGYEVVARERTLAREVAFLSSQAAAARGEIEAYSARIIPDTERAHRETRSAYAQGGLSYIEVLEAEAALAVARERQIAARLMFHKSEIRLARLNGAMSAASSVESFE